MERESVTLLERVLEQMPTAAAILRVPPGCKQELEGTRIEYFNGAMARLAGPGRVELMKAGLLEFLPFYSLEDWTAATRGGAWEGRSSVLHWRSPGGRCYEAECHPLEGGLCAWFVQDESETASLREALSGPAWRDALTGMENWAGLVRYCDDFYRRRPKKVGVACLDINSLRHINKEYGYGRGDETIRAFARVLQETSGDCRLFRICGGFFISVEEGADHEAHLKKFASLVEALKTARRPVVACGYIWEADPRELPGLLSRAEVLMRTDKVTHPCPPDGPDGFPPLLAELLDDLKHGRYLVYLQPKLTVDGKKLYGVEALVRRQDACGNAVPPSAFIGAFERENVISRLDFYMFEQVCRLLRLWRQWYGVEELICSVNFSRLTLALPDTAQRLEEIRQRYEVPAAMLAVEITETRQTISEDQMDVLLCRLKDLGYSLELDDFGKEYSSVTSLGHPELDVVKLDSRLIWSMAESGRIRTLVRSVCSCAHELGMKCLAEGVETAEQLELANAAGCDLVQGYYYAKPMPPTKFEARYLCSGRKAAAVGETCATV